jgi:hypothetical protein
MDASYLTAMAPWLGSSLAPEWTLADLERVVELGAAMFISEGSTQAPIGAAVARLDVPLPATASVPFIVVDPERRYRGLGGEAALAIERHLRRSFGVKDVFAPVPDGRGLAVYFWLRVGYRPLLAAQAPAPVTGLKAEAVRGIWLHRGSE